MLHILVSIGFLAILHPSYSADLPPDFPRCYRDDPEINKCLVKAANDAKPFLVRGIPELGVLPITPYFIPEITLQQGSNSANYKAQMLNTTVLGLDSYTIIQFDYDIPNNKFLVKTQMGPVYLNGLYSVSGKILSIPIQGQGQYTTNITHSNSTLIQKCKYVTKRGVKYLHPVSTTIKLDVGEVTSDQTGLFSGNEVLSKATSMVLKENIKEIVNEVKPVIENVLVKLTEDVLFKTTAKVPYDKLYPLMNSKSAT